MGQLVSTSLRFGVSTHVCSPASALIAPRLAIVDSNRAKGELLTYFCTNFWTYDVVAFENTASAGMAAILNTKPELIIIALNPSDTGTFELVQRLRKICPGSKILIITSLCNEYLVHVLSTLHYHGLIWDAEVGMSDIGVALDRMRKGIRTVSTSIVRCQSSMRTEPTSFPKVLSKRHLEVLACIAHMMSDEEIGYHLGFSVATALSHRQTIMRKLDIHSTPKLISYCIKKGFNSLPPPDCTALNCRISLSESSLESA